MGKSSKDSIYKYIYLYILSLGEKNTFKIEFDHFDHDHFDHICIIFKSYNVEQQI